MSSGGASITSKLAELIVVANAGGSSFVLSNDTQPALFIGTDSKIGVNTLTPTSQLSISSEDGSCLTLQHDVSETAIANINVSSDGDLDLVTNAPGSKVKTSSSFDVVNHNGSSIGFKLGGQMVEAMAEHLNTTTATPGTAAANKAVVLNGDKTVSGITAISATRVTGTLQTSHQPNVTSVGTLESLSVTNDVSASSITGTLQTAAQPNITSVGTLSSLTVTNGVSAGSLTGTLQTASQPNITSVGALSSVSIAGSTLGSETAFLSGAVAGAAANSKVLVLSSSGAISGIASLSATTLTGTLQTSAQPNITSVGTLSSLTVTNNVSATTLTGTLSSGPQPNITSIGALSSVSIAGSTISSEAAFLAGASLGSAIASKVVVLDAQKGISGIGALSASTLTGTLQTPAQPNITSVGALSSITIANSLISSEAAFLSGAVAGTAAPSKALVLNSSGAIGGITSLSATSLTGALQTASQPNITSVGTLSSLGVSGSVSLTSTSDAASSLAGGALTVSGGIAVAKKAYVGTDLYVSGNIYLKGTKIGTSGGSGGSSDPNGYLEITTAGVAEASKALILDSNSEVSGIGKITTTKLEVSGADVVAPVLTIPDGSTSLSGIADVCRSPELSIYVGVGSGGLYSSLDGKTWTSQSIPSGCPTTYTSVSWSPVAKLFVAVSNDTSTTYNYIRSSDGISWSATTTQSPKLPLVAIKYFDEFSTFIAVTYNPTNLVQSVVSTLDGWIWNNVFNTGVSTATPRWNSLTVTRQYSGTGAYLVVCGDQGIVRCTNFNRTGGNTWEWLIPSVVLNSIDWSPQLNVAVAVGANTIRYSTTGGYSWNSATGVPASTTFSNVIWASDLAIFIATVATTSGSNDNRLYSSADGIAWAPYSLQLPTSSTWKSTYWCADEAKLIFVANAGSEKCAVSELAPVNSSSIVMSKLTNTAPMGLTINNATLQYNGTNHKWVQNNYEVMRLNGLGLGIGCTPQRALDVVSKGGRCLRMRDENGGSITFNVNSGKLQMNGRMVLGIDDNENSTSTTSGSLVVYGGVGMSQNATIGGTVTVSGASTLSGALTVNNNITCTGVLRTNNVTDTTGDLTGALIVAGGASISKSLRVGTNLSVAGTVSGITSLTATSITGAIQTAAQPLITSLGTLTGLSVSGNSTLTAVTDSTSTSSGALVVSGGVGVAKNLYVGGTIYMNGMALTTGGGGGGGAATSSSIANWNSTIIGTDYLRYKNTSTGTNYISQQLQAWSNTSYNGQAFSLNSLGTSSSVYFMLNNSAANYNYWQLWAENTSLSITNDAASATPQIYIPYTGTGVRFGKKTTSNTNHRVEVNGSMLIGSTGDIREDLGTTPILGIFHPEHTSGTEKDYIRFGPYGTGYSSSYGSFKIGTYKSGNSNDFNNYMYIQTHNSDGYNGGFRMDSGGRFKCFSSQSELTGVSQQAHVDIMSYINTTISAGQRLSNTGVVASSSASVPLSLYTKYSIASEQPIYALSDRRLKKDIEPIILDDAKRLLTVTPVTYMWKKEIEGARRESGVIAQDLEDAGLEGLVGAIPNSELDDGFQRSVMYDRLTVYLLKLVQDQEARIVQLEKELSKQ